MTNKDCPKCGGSGKLLKNDGGFWYSEQCPLCLGTGKRPNNGDFIRRMNNEQLAHYLNTVEFNWYYDNPILDWLNQPSTEREWEMFLGGTKENDK